MADIMFAAGLSKSLAARQRRKRPAVAADRAEQAWRSSDAGEFGFESTTWLQGTDVDQLRAINTQLQQCASTTKAMVSSLREFDEKLTDLESLVRPVQEQTLELKHAHTNISQTMDTMEKAFEHFRTATTAAPVLRGDGLQSNSYHDYLTEIDRVKASLEFFRQPVPSSFASAAEATLDLERLYVDATKACEVEYTRIVRQESEWAFDLSCDIPDTLTTFRHEAILSLQSLCPRLPRGDITAAGYLETYVSVRSELILNSLKMSTAAELNGDGPAAAGTSTWQHRNSSSGGVQSGPLPQLLVVERRYAQGSHPYIHMAVVAGKLFEAEHAAVDAIMGNLETNLEAQSVLGQTVEPAVRWLCSTAKAVADFTHKVQDLSSLADHILVMLDLSEKIESVRWLGTGAHGTPSDPGDLIASLRLRLDSIDVDFQAAGRSCFKEFCRQLRSPAPWDRPPAVDGTVHQLSTTVVNFLRQATLYQISIESELLPLISSADDGTVDVAAFYRTMVTILIDQLLRHSQSSAAYKAGHLQTTFYLNNICFIYRAIRQDEWSEIEAKLGDSFMAKIRQKRKGLVAEYCQQAWAPVIAHLAVRETASKSKKALKKELKTRFNGFNSLFSRRGEFYLTPGSTCMCRPHDSLKSLSALVATA